MLLFGHLGITLGIFLGPLLLAPRLKSIINLKYLIIGSLLPDLIDKPIGRVIFATSFENGRIIGHTLLFCFILCLIGAYLYKNKAENRYLSLSLGSFIHLIQDEMWMQPPTLLWPLFGLNFPKDSTDYTGIEYLMIMLERSFEPELTQSFISEVLGVGIITIFFLYWLKKKLCEKDPN